MKKLTLSIIALSLFSCATVKKSKTETELKTDSRFSSTLDATKFSNSFTLEPVNLDKPILLGKDTIYNTRVIYNNSKETIIKKDTIVKTTDLKEEKTEKEKDYTEAIETLSNKIILLVIGLFILNTGISNTSASLIGNIILLAVVL